MKVEVVAYNADWPAAFAQEAAKIQAALGRNCITVHHIGSTSVPGLAAKPVIDMIPVVHDILLVDGKNSTMAALGYVAKGEFGIPFRRFFQKIDKPLSYHAHIYAEGNPEITRHLLFRDYMCKHPKLAAEYAALKLKLAKQFPNDIEAYINGKNSFIQAIEEQTGVTGYRMLKACLQREWAEYHRIRNEQLFLPINIIYDPNHWSLKAPNHHHFVLLNGAKIIGTAHIELVTDEYAVLRPFAIDKPFQNKGHGKKFLQLIEKWVSQQGRKYLYLHSVPKAVNFYKREGYQLMDFVDKDKLSPEDIDMGKELKYKN